MKNSFIIGREYKATEICQSKEIRTWKNIVYEGTVLDEVGFIDEDITLHVFDDSGEKLFFDDEVINLKDSNNNHVIVNPMELNSLSEYEEVLNDCKTTLFNFHFEMRILEKLNDEKKKKDEIDIIWFNSEKEKIESKYLPNKRFHKYNSFIKSFNNCEFISCDFYYSLF